LEAAGLVRVDRSDRAGPVVELLDIAPCLPPGFAERLAELVPKARNGMLPPKQVLAAVPRPAAYDGPWPASTTELIRTLRAVNAGHVVRRAGRNWIVLAPDPPAAQR
jgi:hypothetical protein